MGGEANPKALANGVNGIIKATAITIRLLKSKRLLGLLL
jgi:hypothetical protein